MELIRRRAYARAGLIGNPSDAYNGKVISVIVKNFYAQVTLYEWDKLEIIPNDNDESSYRSISGLWEDVKIHGYYGGIRLVKAAIFGFAVYCRERSLTLHQRNFAIRYETNIPRQVGLAGSSAIVVATLRALSDYYHIEIPKAVFPSLVLSIENEQLGIPAGLQDRVAQVYEGCTYMDFAKDVMKMDDGFLRGEYESLPVDLLPPLYISYSTQFGEPTEVFHNNLRFRYNNGEPAVVEAMKKFADLTVQLKQALLERRTEDLSALIDANFDLRSSICSLPKDHILMVETARKCGASAKFAGSGGAIVGTFRDEKEFENLESEMKKIGCNTLRVLQ